MVSSGALIIVFGSSLVSSDSRHAAIVFLFRARLLRFIDELGTLSRRQLESPNRLELDHPANFIAMLPPGTSR
jgi:hypothetical protein